MKARWYPAGESGYRTSMSTADDLIERLELEPHPEGGCFRESFRDARSDGGRAHSTAIYYLLKAGEVSRWHRVDAAEVWHWYAGAPLALGMRLDDEPASEHILGSNIAGGEQPQIVVPAGIWQMARSLGEFTLVGCTVAPGFEFSGFEMAGD